MKIPNPAKRNSLSFCRILLCCFVLIVNDYSALWGQNIEDLNPTASEKERASEKIVAFGLSTGTRGLFGADFAIQLTDYLSLKAGFHYLNVDLNNYRFNLGPFGFDDQVVIVDGQVRQNKIELIGEYAPFKNRLFKVALGAAYLPDNLFSGTVLVDETIVYQDITVTPEEIGYVQGDVTRSVDIAPYAGIGFGQAVPRKRIGFSVDLGVYYLGKPELDLEATNLLRNNDQNEDQLEENISPYRWWPNLSFRLAFKLNKKENGAELIPLEEIKPKKKGVPRYF